MTVKNELFELTRDWSCAFYEAGLDPKRVLAVIASVEGENDGDSWLAVVLLRDYSFAFLAAWCDYTGWDCQAGGERYECESLADLMRGHVGEEHAKRLGLPMPEGSR